MEAAARRLLRLPLPALPFLTSLLLALVATLPVYTGHVGEAMPPLGVVAVFYWAVYRPDLLTYAAAFAVGLVIDLVSGAPPGLTALVLVAVRRLVLDHRGFLVGRPFHVLWLGFLVAVAAAQALAWCAASLYLLWAVDPAPLVLGGMVALLVFPAIAWLLRRCQLILPLTPSFTTRPH